MSCWELKLTEMKCLWFSRGLHGEAQPSDCPQSAPGGGHTCRRTVRGDFKILCSFYIYRNSLCVFSSRSLPTQYQKTTKMRGNFWHVVFLAVLSGCCLFRQTVEWTCPANWTRTKQNESLTKVQKVFTLHDTILINTGPLDLNLRVKIHPQIH